MEKSAEKCQKLFFDALRAPCFPIKFPQKKTHCLGRGGGLGGGTRPLIFRKRLPGTPPSPTPDHKHRLYKLPTHMDSEKRKLRNRNRTVGATLACGANSRGTDRQTWVRNQDFGCGTATEPIARRSCIHKPQKEQPKQRKNKHAQRHTSQPTSHTSRL